MSSMNSPIKEGVYLTYRRFVQGLALSSAFAGGGDDPLLNNLMINQLEVRAADDGNPLVWDAVAWIGKDLNEFWIINEAECVTGILNRAGFMKKQRHKS